MKNSSQYVHTTGDIIEPNQLKLIDNCVNNYLFSLIAGLRQGSFGFDTLHRVTQEIIEYKKVLGNNRKFFIDSGGYSIIAGDVSPRDVSKFIECYNLFFEKDAPNNCDYIFSLDIPIFLKFKEFNNVSKIYEMNSKSIKESKKVLEKNKELYNKFIYVWQFKLHKQNAIWKKIYDEEFRQNSNLRHFAIGGLVGLRGVTNIQFSPFIGPAYRCLNIINNKNLEKESILHILGVYGLHDRVMLSFMHKLFNQYYLKDRNCKIQVTYDTVNYTLSGLYKLREQIIFIPENDDYICDYSYNLIDKIDRIIDNPDVLKIIQNDLKKIIAGEQVVDTRMSSLLNVLTQTTIDKIINDTLDKNNVVEMFIDCKNFNKFKNKISPILMNLEKKYPLVFGNRSKKNLLNWQYCYAFHDAYMTQSEEAIEKLIDKFIDLIGFPFDLEG